LGTGNGYSEIDEANRQNERKENLHHLVSTGTRHTTKKRHK
jgi:hypothetical protein